MRTNVARLGPEAGKKARTHGRIVAAASRLFRRDGFRNTAVDALMAQAGLTRGGFYAHFRDKTALFAETLQVIFADSRANLFARGLEDERGAEWVEAASRRYLDWRHRERADDGCAIPSLGNEVARGPSSLRATFAAEIDCVIEEMAERLEAPGSEDARKRAVALLASWVGAMVLARAIPDRRRAEAVLVAVREMSPRLAASKPPPQPKRRPVRTRGG